jgi:ribosomal protein S18 acetylase RimI-like enzyme
VSTWPAAHHAIVTVATCASTAFGHRRVELPGGAVLEVRPVRSGDVDGLARLYATLSDDDRYRRFFSWYQPPRSFFEHMVGVVERGGYGVVAVDGDGNVVGEANYELLPDGDGELGMVVAPSWRGWLGAYLLDTLIEAAEARGVPDIEADVLVTNARMLALLRSRGYATLASDDWMSLRLIVGTHGRTPVWPYGSLGPPDHEAGPRLLVEVPGGRWRAGEDARAAGLQVITCSGPSGAHPRCPVLAGRPCPLVAAADAVVVANAPDDERWRRLVSAHAGLHPDVPVCVEPRTGPHVDVSTVERLASDHQATRLGRSPAERGGAVCTP